MTLTRRLLAPLLVGALVALTLLAPGSVAAKGTPLVGPTGATGPTGPTGSLQTVTASVLACHADPLQANRYAIFAAQLTAVPDTRTMSVEFSLQERSAGSAAFVTVPAPGFDAWITSQPGVGIYTYNHEVTSLPAPAAFRVLVHARWLDRHRHVIRRDQLLSPVCAQPLETPNLSIAALRRGPGAQAGTETYGVQVLNSGAVAAGAFQVSLTVNGVALPEVAVASLAADTAQVVQFDGPACTAGSTLTAVADPGGAVVEPANPARSRAFACTR